MDKEPGVFEKVLFSVEARQKLGRTLRLTISTTLRYDADEDLVLERLRQPVFLQLDLSEAAVNIVLEREERLLKEVEELRRSLAFKEAELNQLRPFGSPGK